mgnify:FL=1
MTGRILNSIGTTIRPRNRRPRRKIFRLVRAGKIWLSAGALCLALPVFAAPEPWQVWREHNPESTRRVDHTAWQRFLEVFVVAGEDGINRVAYQQARADAGPDLQRYLQELAAIDPRTLTRDQQMAYWINLYNALTVDVVLRHPGKQSIRRMGQGFFSFGPWDDALLSVAGIAMTLNDIEHRILRPIWQDQRIHYAVNCASLGCPNLSQTAYTAENLNRQLSEAEKTYLRHPRGVSFDSRGRLQLSSIFEWYREDFAETEQGLLEYLAQHHPEAERLLEYQGRISYRYDWQLNALTNSQ